MAVAKETEGLTELEKQFRCITVCSLCQRTFTYPKILPCFHSFCLHCLNENTTRNLQSGATANCPTCRIDFEIPKQGIAALPTDKYVDRIIATADALSSTLQLASFERTEGSDLCAAADLSDPVYRRHDYGRGRSTTQIGITSITEESHQGYASDKMQRMCQKHMRKLDNYCSICTRVICKVCVKEKHNNHRVISVALATKDVRQIIDSYLNGVRSCQAYYRAQKNICEERTTAANVIQIDSTPFRPDCTGIVKSDSYAKVQSPSPLSSTSVDLVTLRKAGSCLDSWKEYVERFHEEITTRERIHSNICKIAKELHKLHDTWSNSYEQWSLVQQTQNCNLLQIAEAESKPNIMDTLFMRKISPTRKVSPNKQTLSEGSVTNSFLS